MNVFILSRTQSKLDATAEAIRAKYPKVEVKTLAIDFSKFDDAAQQQVKKELEQVEVGVLINNVGVSYPFCKFFHELTDSEVKDLIELNVNSTTWMTRIVLPKMVERKKGAVVNISSTAGVVPSPLLAQYSAAKSYIDVSLFSVLRVNSSIRLVLSLCMM